MAFPSEKFGFVSFWPLTPCVKPVVSLSQYRNPTHTHTGVRRETCEMQDVHTTTRRGGMKAGKEEVTVW